MSGGYFDYNQYMIWDIADSIEYELNKQGKKKSKEELYYNKDFYEQFPDEKYHRTYPKDVQDRMKEAVKQLRIAVIYADAIDKFLSGDYDDDFVERLDDNLKKFNDVRIDKNKEI